MALTARLSNAQRAALPQHLRQVASSRTRLKLRLLCGHYTPSLSTGLVAKETRSCAGEMQRTRSLQRLVTRLVASSVGHITLSRDSGLLLLGCADPGTESSIPAPGCTFASAPPGRSAAGSPTPGSRVSSSPLWRVHNPLSSPPPERLDRPRSTPHPSSSRKRGV